MAAHELKQWVALPSSPRPSLSAPPKPFSGHANGGLLSAQERAAGVGDANNDLANHLVQQDIRPELVRRQLLPGLDDELAPQASKRAVGGRTDSPQTGTSLANEQNLMIKLFENTFVSLQASNCIELPPAGQPQQTNATSAAAGNESNQIRLCLIDDWWGARILQANGTVLWPVSSSGPPPEVTASDTLLDYLDGGAQLGEHHQQQQQSQQQSRAVLDSTDAAGVQSAAIKLAYISTSTVISLLGILANLLILMIIVINTKQKCPNFLSRAGQTSHTNYHFVLLFQLTLTGLLLSSYVLFSVTIGPVGSDLDGPDLGAAERPSLAPLSIYLAPPDYRPSTFDELQMKKQDCPTKASIVLRLAAVDGGPSGGLAYAVQGDPIAVSNLMANNRPLCKRQAGRAGDDEGDHYDGLRLSPIRLIFDLVAAIHVWTVAALAYDRYCAIAYPLEYLRAVGTSRVKSFLLVLWLVALLVVVLLPVALDLFEAWARRPPDEWLDEKLLRRLVGNCSSDCSYELETNDLNFEMGHRLARALTNVWSLSGAHTERGPAGRNDDDEPDDGAGWGGRERTIDLMQITLSCLTFMVVVVAPLVIVTTCNMSIYGIVKGHERRMSASSGSQAQSNCGTAGGPTPLAGLRHNLAHNLALFRRDVSFCGSNAEHQEIAIAPQRSDICSSASSIFGKLVKASHQVGTSMACERSLSTSSANSNVDDHDACNLIAIDHHRKDSSYRSGGEDNEIAPDHSIQAAEDGEHSTGSQSYKSHTDHATDVRSTRRRLVSKKRDTTTAGNSWSHNRHEAPSNSTSGLKTFLKCKKRKLKRKLSDKEEKAQMTQDGQTDEQQTLLANHQGYQHRAGPPCGGAFDACSCYSGRSQQSQPHSVASSMARHNPSHLDSDGIMRQLKLAGLSFAGIAISELMQSDGRRTLNRSSSCSLGNLANNSGGPPNGSAGNRLSNTPAAMLGHIHLQQQQQQQQPPPPQQQQQQRSGCQSSAEQVDKRSSYVSLANYNCPASSPRKYSTRLVNSDLDSLDSLATSASATNRHNQLLFGNSSSCSFCKGNICNGRHWQQTCSRQQSGHLNQLTAGSSRMQFNVVFNVVVWLILALLICSLPQYCLLLLLRLSAQSASLGSTADQPELLDGPEDILRSFLNPREAHEQSRNSNWSPLEISLTWLTCLSRLLFILMLPLNAWLYGIRSRSLKTTLRMMLRKYISKKQASIEIDQRRKSVMSMRSRESSIAGAGCANQMSFTGSPLHQSQRFQESISKVHSQQQQHHCSRHHQVSCRMMRRCASFNLPPTSGRLQRPDGPTADYCTNDDASPNLKSHNSAIRFVLGEDHASQPHEEPRGTAQFKERPEADPGAQSKLFDCFNHPPSAPSDALGPRATRPTMGAASQASSLGSSLASSNRSLLSASIQSSQSAAFLLLNPSVMSVESNNISLSPNQAASTGTILANPAAREPPVSVLKGSRQRKQATRMRHQGSCESACPPSSTARRPSILVRVQSSPGKLVANRQSNSRRLHQLDLSSSGSSASNDQKGPPQTSRIPQFKQCARSSSSDIKLLLTSAEEDHQETKDLLPTCGDGGGCGDDDDDASRPHQGTNEAPDEETVDPTSETRFLTSEDRLVGGQASREANLSGLIKREQQHQQQQLDYYRQIKSAITRYFVSLQQRRNRNQLAEGRRCSCCSLEIDPDCRSCGQTSSSNSQFRPESSSDCTSESDQSIAVASFEHFCKLRHTGSLALVRRASLDGPAQIPDGATSGRRSSCGKGGRSAGHSVGAGAPAANSAGTRISTARRTSCSIGASSSGVGLKRDIKPSLSVDSMVAKAPQLSKHEPAQEQEHHLKPPNSLNLIFDPLLGAGQGKQALYSSSLALSPIKECSSNHSCASSQSSLNNVALQVKQPVKVEENEGCPIGALVSGDCR